MLLEFWSVIAKIDLDKASAQVLNRNYNSSEEIVLVQNPHVEELINRFIGAVQDDILELLSRVLSWAVDDVNDLRLLFPIDRHCDSNTSSWHDIDMSLVSKQRKLIFNVM